MLRPLSNLRKGFVLALFGWVLGLSCFAQQKTISGTITSSEDNVPLEGVSVNLRGTNQGTISDNQGHFSLTISDEGILDFTFTGYRPIETPTTNIKNPLNISMQFEFKSTEEVVVIGYGTQKKSDLTGAVQRADIDILSKDPNPSLGALLHGTVPGLNVGATTTAGSDPTISIRGQTSISGSTSPLIVLDGIIYRGSLIDIDPNDIASIDVLKDASATAIYGSQASNGVILITTKMGKTKGPTVNYGYSYSHQEISNKKMLPLDANGFYQRLADRYLTESRVGPDLLTPNPDWDVTKEFVDPSMLIGFQEGLNINYWDLLTNENPFIQKNSLSIGGRGDKINYFVSFGYTDQKNVIKNDLYKRYSYRINFDMAVTNWLKIGTQSFLTSSNYSGVSPSLSTVVGTPPMVPYLNPDGSYIRQPFMGNLNPFLQMDQQDLDKRTNLNGTFYLSADIPFIKGLNYRLNFSEYQIEGKEYNFNPYGANFTGLGSKGNSNQHAYTADNIISYRNTFGAHSVYATFVYGIEKRQYEDATATAQGFNNFVLGYNSLQQGAADLQSASSSAWQESSLYSMGRLVYSYLDRYILTGTIRRDGFSGFGENNKYGTFPSVALAWKINEEPFFENTLGKLNNLKLRMSYGMNGNRTVDRYQTLSRIQSSLGNGYLYGDNGTAEIGQFISSLSNSGLKWETTNSLNFGLDFGLVANRINGSIDVYTATTHDLLYNINIPQINGFSSIPMNIGKLKNSGIELNLNTVPIASKDLRWEVTFNFSRNRNKVVTILGPDKNGVEEDLVSSSIFIGRSLGAIYNFNIIGMWQMDDFQKGIIPDGFTYGTYKVEDVNGDGKYTAADDRKVLGFTLPSYRFSIMSSLKFRSWTLSFLVNSVQGGKNYYYGQPGSSLPNPDNVHNSNSFTFDYWTPENTGARYRQLGFYTVAMGETFSPYIQRNFIRLQDLTLSYNLSGLKFIKDAKINNLNIFLSGYNLITLTDWDGWDPETGTGLDPSAYPLLRNFTIGLNLQF